MTLKTINLGNYANDGTGDDLRTAFEKVNFNFGELSGTSSIVNASNLGSGQGVFAQRNAGTLEFKSLTSTDNSITLSHTSTTVNLHANTTVENDTQPVLSGDLDLNGNRIIDTSPNGDGDVQTTIYGVSVPIISTLLALLIESNSFVLDLGDNFVPAGRTSELPSGYILDMGYFNNPAGSNPLNFGSF